MCLKMYTLTAKNYILYLNFKEITCGLRGLNMIKPNIVIGIAGTMYSTVGKSSPVCTRSTLVRFCFNPQVTLTSNCGYSFIVCSLADFLDCEMQLILNRVFYKKYLAIMIYVDQSRFKCCIQSRRNPCRLKVTLEYPILLAKVISIKTFAGPFFYE